MKRHHRIALARAAALLATALLAVPAALAANGISGFAQIRDVQFSLADLTPTDAQVAHFDFGPRESSFDTFFRFGDAYDASYVYPLFPVPIDNSFTVGTSEVGTTSNGQFGDLRSAFFSGTTQGPFDYAYTSAWQSTNILLSARSELTITGLAFAAVATPDSSLSTDFAGAFLNVLLDHVSTPQADQLFNASLILPDDVPSISFDEAFSFTVRNDRDVDIEVRLVFETGASYENQSAVPEPGTYLMLLAGLGVVVTAYRRNRRQEDATALR